MKNRNNILLALAAVALLNLSPMLRAQSCGDQWQNPTEPITDCTTAYGDVGVAVRCDQEYVINVQCGHVPGNVKGQCIAEGMEQVVANEAYWDCLVSLSCNGEHANCGEGFNYQPHKVFDASSAIEWNAKLDLHMGPYRPRY